MVKAPPPGDLAHRINAELLAYFDVERAMLEPEAQTLLAELEALVTSGGKRLRPRFAYWGYRAAGGADGIEIVRVGAALEILHTMAMIQDDVMDASSVRRNRASAFLALAELSASVPHRGDPKRFGASAAVLTGLLGFVLADRRFWTAGFDANATRRAAERYDRMRGRAIAGQYLDLLSAHRGQADEATARRIAALKSGSYSVADPLAIGALLATDDAAIVDALGAYGLPLGEAFQIRDDVLSTFGDPTITGKDGDGDVKEGKQTVLLAKARALASSAQLRVLDEVVGNRSASGDDVDRVRDVMVVTGAFEDTNRLIAELNTQAKTALNTTILDREARRALDLLADEATTRYA